MNKNNNLKPFFTIIMNCHNGEKYLKKSLNSLINQSYDNWELIFWDNQSQDNSKKILESYNEKKFKYFYNKNKTTLYKARNLAIEKATGDYICFLDTDDFWASNKLKKQKEFLEKNQDFKIVYSNYYINNELKKKITIRSKKLLPYGYITEKLLKDYNLGILTVCLKKSIFEKFSFNNDYNIIGDFDFFINLSLKEKIGCIQLPLAYYRIHNDNYSDKQIRDYIKELSNWLRNHKFLEKGHNLSLFYQKIYIFKLNVKYYLKKFKFFKY